MFQESPYDGGMRGRLLFGQLLRALFISGAWYWRALTYVTSALLIGLPEWADRFPTAARMVAAFGLPDWFYGLAGSVIVALYFAYRMADMTTPKVVAASARFGTSGYVRLDVENVSMTRCTELMCTLVGIYPGCADDAGRDPTNLMKGHLADLPLVLTTQNRLRYSKSHGQPLKTGRWKLDPGHPKAVEVAWISFNEARIPHESGEEKFDVQEVTTLELRISGDTAPVTAHVVIYHTDIGDDGKQTLVMLARDKLEMLALQQIPSCDLMRGLRV